MEIFKFLKDRSAEVAWLSLFILIDNCGPFINNNMVLLLG